MSEEGEITKGGETVAIKLTSGIYAMVYSIIGLIIVATAFLVNLNNTSHDAAIGVKEMKDSIVSMTRTITRQDMSISALMNGLQRGDSMRNVLAIQEEKAHKERMELLHNQEMLRKSYEDIVEKLEEMENEE